MTARIISYVNARVGGSENIALTVPSPGSFTSILMSDVVSLNSTLDLKLNDTLSMIGNNITATGNDLNLLTDMEVFGLLTSDFEKLANIDASADEINHLNRINSNIQTQLDSKLPLDGSLEMAGSLNVNGHNLILNSDPDGSVFFNGSPIIELSLTIDSSVEYVWTPDFFNVMNNRISNVGLATEGTDALSRDAGDARYVTLRGDIPLTGSLNLDSNDLILINREEGVRENSFFRFDISDNSIVLWINGGAEYAWTSSVFNLTGNDMTNVERINGMHWSEIASGITKLANIEDNAKDDQNATEVSFTSSGSLSDNVGEALNELETLVGNRLELTGGTMSGSIDMNGHNIDLNGGEIIDISFAGGHNFNTDNYRSGTEGNSALIRTTTTANNTTPTYSFISDPRTGLYHNGAGIALTIDGTNKITINDIDINFEGSRITGIADPTNDTDAINFGWVQNQMYEKVLGTISGINANSTSTNTIYTVPSGKKHIITKIILLTTQYTPGSNPTNPNISIGTNNSSPISIVTDTEINWGDDSGASRTVIINSINGATTPNSNDIINITVSTAATNFTNLEFTVYIMGIEI